jgi:PAS domain S-box-containing protein
MNTTPIRVLILEDRGVDVELVLDALRTGGLEVDWQWVDNEKDFVARLDSPFDIVLADYYLPQFSALQALKHLQRRRIDTPVLLVSGAVGEELAVEAMREGVVDFINKDRLGRLAPAVARALGQKRLREERRVSDELLHSREHRYRKMLERSFAGVMLLNDRGTILYASPGTRRVLGYGSEECVGKNVFEFVHPQDRNHARGLFDELLRNPSDSVQVQYRYRRKDGTWHWRESVETNLLAEPDVAAIVDNYHDITALKRLEAELRALHQPSDSARSGSS